MLGATILISLLLRLASGMEMMCGVSHDGERTAYSILNMPSGETREIVSFTWSNKTKHVLANSVGKMKPVINSSFSTLATSGCSENIVWEGHVISGGTLLDYTANCTTNCSANAPVVDKGGFPSWIPVVGVVGFLALAGFICFLCCKCNKLRKCCCGQTGGYYNVVKMQKNEQVTIHMEEGNG